jgi:Trk-type K+ transport system membrane component
MITIQIGGLGIMSLAALMGLAMSKKLGLTARILTVSDLGTSKYGQVGSVIKTVVFSSFVIEAICALLLLPHFASTSEHFLDALWNAVFFSVSAFNNAGFDISTVQNGMVEFGSHWGVALPLIFCFAMGGIGFPVIQNVLHCIKHRKFSLISLNTKLVLLVYFSMDLIILVWVFAVEWNNSALFPSDITNDPSRHAAGLSFAALASRASGFPMATFSNMHDSTLFLFEIWMLIGGAPASTTAGIKVTTVAVLFLALRAEYRRHRDMTAFGKRLPSNALRLAGCILLLELLALSFFIVVLLEASGLPMETVVFDVVSAFTDSGISLGLVEQANNLSLVLLGVAMFAGRLGTMTIVAALTKPDPSDAVRFPTQDLVMG